MASTENDNHPLISRQVQLNPVNQIINKLGFGNFQLLNLFSIGIIFFIQGSEITLLSILSFILQEQWDLSTFQTSFIGGGVLVGMGIGFLTCIILEPYLGRVWLLKLSVWQILIAGLGSSMMVQIYGLAVCRAIVGIGAGISLPIVTALLAQMCPSHIRARYLLIGQLFFVLGSLFVSGMAFIFTPDLEGENWRWLTAIPALPCIPSLFLIQIYTIESPLFLGQTKQYEKAVQNLNIIARRNSKPDINQAETDTMYSIIPMNIQNGAGRFRMMVDKWHWKLTIKLIALWTIVCYCYYGFLFIVPFYLDLDDSRDTLIVITVALAFQIPLLVVASYYVEKKLFGRKNSIIILSVICIVFSFMAFIENDVLKYIMIVALLDFQMISFIILIPYTSEVFETEIRVLGFSTCNVIARTFSGFAVYFLYLFIGLGNIYLIFFIALLIFVQLLLAVSLPFDTTGIMLDSAIKDY